MRKIYYCLLSAVVASMLFCVEVSSQSIDELRRYDTTFVVEGASMVSLYRLSMEWFVEEFYHEGCQVTLMNVTLGRLRGDHCMDFQSAEDSMRRVAYIVAIDVLPGRVHLVISDPVYTESDRCDVFFETPGYKQLRDSCRLMEVRDRWFCWSSHLDYVLTCTDRRPRGIIDQSLSRESLQNSPESTKKEQESSPQ
jgi:hypothetical protein